MKTSTSKTKPSEKNNNQTLPNYEYSAWYKAYNSKILLMDVFILQLPKLMKVRCNPNLFDVRT